MGKTWTPACSLETTKELVWIDFNRMQRPYCSSCSLNSNRSRPDMCFAPSRLLTQRLFPLSTRITPIPLTLCSFVQRRYSILSIHVVLRRCKSDLTEDVEVECFLAEKKEQWVVGTEGEKRVQEV
jgi:hypothetical protein